MTPVVHIITLSLCWSYELYIDDGEDIDFEVNFLPLLDLTTFPGVMELENNQADATSEAITIPDGLIFGNKIATLAYVSYNQYQARLLTCKVPVSNYIVVILINHKCKTREPFLLAGPIPSSSMS